MPTYELAMLRHLWYHVAVSERPAESTRLRAYATAYLPAYLGLRSVWLLLFSVFHLVELWPVFRGFRYAVPRLNRFGFGLFAIATQIVLVLAPLVAWTVLAVLRERDRLEIPSALSADTMVLRGGGRVRRLMWRMFRAERIHEWITLAFLWLHVAQFWGRKVFFGANAYEVHSRMFSELGSPGMLVTHALVLWVVCLHLIVSGSQFVAHLREQMDGPLKPSLAVATLALLLCVGFMQLLGFVGTGTGTFWPIRVQPPAGMQTETSLDEADAP